MMLRHPFRRAFTLLEMSLSLVIVATITLALGSAVVIASRAMPTDDAPGVAAVEQMRALQQVRLDLAEALFFRELSATVAEVVVSDRNDDGAGERIRYAWDGTPGHALTRSLNDGTPEIILDRVMDITLKKRTETISRTPAGALREQDESAISSYTDTVNPEKVRPDQAYAVGVSFTPDVPDGTEQWRMVAVYVYASTHKTADGQLLVRLSEADDTGLPTSTVIAEVIVPETIFNTSDAWTRIDLAAEGLRPGQRYAVTFHDVGPGQPVDLKTQASIPDEPKQSFVATSGTSWSQSESDSLIYQILGVAAVREPATSITRTRTRSLDITITSSASHIDAISLLNTPEPLQTRYALDFTRDPTTVDADADGTLDWICGSSFDSSQLSKGIWTVTQRISTTGTGDMTTLATIDASLRDSTDDGMNGISLGVVCDRSAGLAAQVAVRVRRSGASQVVELILNDMADTPRVVSTTRLDKTGFVDVRLVIDPDNDLVNLMVDGTEIDSFGYRMVATALSAGVRINAQDLDPGAQIDDLLMTMYAP